MLTDIVGNQETVSRLSCIALDGNMPNLILCGPPGTGKTTSVHALAREILGSEEAYKRGVLELNASDSRGIDVVRSKIKMFAQSKVNLPKGRHKIIVLDEADSMTTSAQQALRRTMEVFSNTTRFALACNISSKIIEPIQSRAAILRYSRLSDADVLSRLKVIAAAENVSYADDGMEAIIFTSEGDMRNGLNNLQATFEGFGFVNEANVFKVCDQPHPTVVKKVVESCVDGKVKNGIRYIQELHSSGYSPMDIIGTLFKVVKSADIDEGVKLEFLREIGFAHMNIADGSATLLQLVGLIGRLGRVCVSA